MIAMPPGLDRAAVERIVREIVLAPRGTPPSQAAAVARAEPKLVVSISARHCHLTDEHVEKLFGPGHTLTPMKSLYQDGFYAAEETVMVVGVAFSTKPPILTCALPVLVSIRMLVCKSAKTIFWASSCAGRLTRSPLALDNITVEPSRQTCQVEALPCKLKTLAPSAPTKSKLAPA